MMRLDGWLVQATERLVRAGIEPDEARVEARLLAQQAFQLTREQLITHGGVFVTEDGEALLARREAREPLAYLLGSREFYGLRFLVTPAVLIPRPETELLVETALAHPRKSRVADIGTGSGCIAVSVAAHLPGAQVFATDLSEEALEVARTNAMRHNAHNLTFLSGDLLAPLPEVLPFDVIVSNPPYIAPDESATLAPEVLAEPHLALFDTGGGGLGFYRRLTARAPAYLAPGGLLAVEAGQGQAEEVMRHFIEAGFIEVATLPDLAGIGRVVRGIQPER